MNVKTAVIIQGAMLFLILINPEFKIGNVVLAIGIIGITLFKLELLE